MPTASDLRRLYTQAEVKKSIWTNVHFSHALKLKILLYFIPIIVLSIAIPHVFITSENLVFSDSGRDKMLYLSETTGVDYLAEYTKIPSLHFDAIESRLNILSNTLLKSYSLRKNGITSNILVPPAPAKNYTWDEVSSNLTGKYQSLVLNSVIRDIYDKDGDTLSLTTFCYHNFQTIDDKAWMLVQGFSTLNSHFRGTIARLKGDFAYITQAIIFYNPSQIIAAYPGINVATTFANYNAISALTNLTTYQNFPADSKPILTTLVMADYYKNTNKIVYMVKSLQLEGDTEVTGGIALGIRIDTFFSYLQQTSISGVCTFSRTYIVMKNGTIFYQDGQEILEKDSLGSILNNVNISGTLDNDIIAEDVVNFMAKNSEAQTPNATFYKIYNFIDEDELKHSIFPIVYARLLNPDIMYYDQNLYVLAICYPQAPISGLTLNESEVDFVDTFHWILDSVIFLLFGLALVYTVNLFTREILSPIKQISAKFIEITQAAFNSQELRHITFEDILIKEDTEIKDFHACVCESFNSLIQEKSFLNEGEFQEHKSLYKNKVLKKVYEEKNVLKPIKAVHSRVPDKSNLGSPTHEGMIENYDGFDDNATVTSKTLL